MKQKLPVELLIDYPLVRVFFLHPPDSDTSSVRELHLIRSNGIGMICCTKAGTPYLVRLQDVVKVSPLNNDYFICRYDAPTGCIICRKMATGDHVNFGPVRGQPEPNVSLTKIADDLGLDLWGLDTFPTEADDVDTYRALTTAEALAGPDLNTYEHLMSSVLDDDNVGHVESYDDLPPPPKIPTVNFDD